MIRMLIKRKRALRMHLRDVAIPSNQLQAIRNLCQNRNESAIFPGESGLRLGLMLPSYRSNIQNKPMG